LKMNKPLSVAIVGCGYVANEHAIAWRRVKGVKLVACCDINEKFAKSFSERYGIPKFYVDFEELIKKELPSIVDICTPPQTHKSLAVQAMKLGCHVLLEKPMAMSLVDAEEIISAWKKSDVMLCVVHNWLFQPVVLEVRKMVEEGCLGKVVGIQVEALHTGGDPMTTNLDHWAHKIPGGRFGETSVHPIYLIQHFLGNQLEVVNVSLNKIDPNKSWMPYDELYSITKGPSGLGTIHISYSSPRDLVAMIIYGTKRTMMVDLSGNAMYELGYASSGKITLARGVGLLKQSLKIFSSLVKNTAKVATRRFRMNTEILIQEFAKSVLSMSKPPVDPMSAYEAVKALEKITKEIEAKK
jgi:predicted dehydrogenase